MNFLNNMVERLKEPSTWAGLGLLLPMVGLHGLDLQHLDTLAQTVPALLAIFVPEAKA